MSHPEVQLPAPGNLGTLGILATVGMVAGSVLAFLTVLELTAGWYWFPLFLIAIFGGGYAILGAWPKQQRNVIAAGFVGVALGLLSFAAMLLYG